MGGPVCDAFYRSDTWSPCQRFGFPWRFGLSGGRFGPRGRWLRRPSGVLPRRVGSQLPAGAWFIAEVRSLQDLRQQEDR
eukprot:scaffold40148_cov62-Phaeocystis_antarctica.AAC.1